MSNARLLLILLVALNLLAFAAIRGWLGGSDAGGEPERISNQLKPELIRLLGDAAPPATPPPMRASTTAEAPVDRASAASALPTPAAQAAPEELPDAPDGATVEPVPAPSPQASAPAVPAAAPSPHAAPTADAAAPSAQCFAWSGLSEAEAGQLLGALREQGVDARRGPHQVPVSWWVRIAPEGGLEGAQERNRALRALGIADSYIVQDEGPSQYAISLGLFKTAAGAERMVEELRARGLLDAGMEPRMRQTVRVQATLSAEARDAVERCLPRVHRLRDDCAR